MCLALSWKLFYLPRIASLVSIGTTINEGPANEVPAEVDGYPFYKRHISVNKFFSVFASFFSLFTTPF